ncbi:MAG: FAD-dependent monooxygenase [Pseudomonadota bacterium]|nr:FAD-dependent monooxygenase [Pseudomonadota bacterium]
MKSTDILVRGAGPVGLAAALALSRQGFAVTLVGALQAPVAPDVRAYALNPASVALLRSLKVWDALPADARTAVQEMHVEGDAAGAAIDFSAWSMGLEALAWIVDAAELDKALRAAAGFAPHLTLLDAATAEPVADLQVLAEGRDSAARRQLGVDMPRHDYGQQGLAARLVSPQPHAGLARQWFRSPDVLALLPLDRPAFEGRTGHGLALVWSLPEAAAERLLALPDDDFTAALMDATGGAAGPLKLVGERASWPLTMAHADHLHGPGWVLLGDAAHVVHPLAGQGLNLGLADVAALAAVMADRNARESWRPLSDPRLLAGYARQRQGPTRVMAQTTDGLLQLFASQQPIVKELRNRGLSLLNHLPLLKRFLTGRAIGT